MKNRRNVVVLKILLISFSVCVFSNLHAQENKPVKVLFSHVESEDSPKGQMAKYFQKLVRENIGKDTMVVSVLSNADSDEGVLNGVLNNDVEFAAPSLSLIKQYSPRYQLFDLPFLFSSSAAAEAFLKGDYAMRLGRSLKQKGLYVFGYMTAGMKQISSTQKVIKPQDMRNMKISSTDSYMERAWIKELGASPIGLSFSQTSSAVVNNEVDAQMSVYSNMYSNEFHKHQKYILDSNHIHQGYIILTSQAFMDSLPENIQEQVKKMMGRAMDYGNDIAKKRNDRDMQKIIDSGEAEITLLTVDQRQHWITKMLPIWKRMESEVGRELIQAAASQR